MAEPAEARDPYPSFAWRLGFLYAALFLVVGCYLPYLPIWLHWRDLDADQIAVLLATPLFIRILFTPAISFAADLLGGRRAILIALAWGSLVSFLLLWAADGFWQMLLATALLAINWTTIMPLIETVAVAGIRSGALDYWQGQAVGLAQLHRGEPRLGPPHRYARGRDSSAAAPGGNGADGPWRPFLAA
ncbi:MAG TPA: hypothetical protein DCQ79_06180 [Rhizobiales bacterium]|nr:hypothetical protein [Hyphomicrobiales bacterium]